MEKQDELIELSEANFSFETKESESVNPHVEVTSSVGAERNTKSTTRLALGRGLDVGTANLVAAAQTVDGEVNICLQRNAFIDIAPEDHTRNMLNQLGVPYIEINGNMVVVGDHAFKLANVFNRATRRPMKDGMISSQEADAMPIEQLLLQNLLGEPTREGEVCYFTIPADPIDADLNVIYHKGVFSGLLRGLKYTPKALLEGHAVVYSELAEDDFTGIGISCGGGMFNICVAYQAIPAVSFATTRGGDWIDKNVAQVLGVSASRATSIKERGIDITKPKNREEEAVEIYYRNLIAYTLENIKKRFMQAADRPNFSEPISIVCAGGTSLVGGFIEVFQDEFKNINFPIEVKDIRLAEDPLYTVAKGCLVAALSESA
ncbi:MAG: hypothetical protein AB7O52_01240 [Planctomycetota bacterium]